MATAVEATMWRSSLSLESAVRPNFASHRRLATALRGVEYHEKRCIVTITLDLPPHVEQAYIAAAEARGLPLTAIVREVMGKTG